MSRQSNYKSKKIWVLAFTQAWNNIAEFEARTSKSWRNADPSKWEANRSAKMTAYEKLAERLAQDAVNSFLK